MCVSSTVCAVLIGGRGGVGHAEPAGTVHPAFRAAIVAMVAAFPVAMVVAAMVVRDRHLEFSRIGRRFVIGAATVGVASLVATLGLALLLWRVTLDPPDETEPPEEPGEPEETDGRRGRVLG
jgi:cation transporter-like permease